jgi:Phosphate transport regulator (distant homolog of PhoU)
MSNFFSKGPDYFGLFETGIGISAKAAKVLQASFSDGMIDKSEIKQLKEIEHEGDRHVHDSTALISDAFLTPIDRSDMMEMVRAIEAITDSIDDIGNQIYMMHISKASETTVKLVDLIVKSCEGLCTLMSDFKQFKKNSKSIKEMTVLVNHLEEEGDAVFEEAMRELFDPDNKMEMIDVIRLQNLYNTMENALDYCEDVADIAEQIIISNT